MDERGFLLLVLLAALLWAPSRKAIGLLFIILGTIASLTVIGLLVGIPLLFVGGVLLFIGQGGGNRPIQIHLDWPQGDGGRGHDPGDHPSALPTPQPPTEAETRVAPQGKAPDERQSSGLAGAVVRWCVRCDCRLVAGGKFCASCGAPVSEPDQVPSEPWPGLVTTATLAPPSPSPSPPPFPRPSVLTQGTQGAREGLAVVPQWSAVSGTGPRTGGEPVPDPTALPPLAFVANSLIRGGRALWQALCDRWSALERLRGVPPPGTDSFVEDKVARFVQVAAATVVFLPWMALGLVVIVALWHSIGTRRAGVEPSPSRMVNAPPTAEPLPPTTEPTAQPVAGPTFIVNSMSVLCLRSPSLDAQVVMQLAPGTVLAMDQVLDRGNARCHREVDRQCWVSTSQPAIRVFPTLEEAESYAVSVRPTPTPTPTPSPHAARTPQQARLAAMILTEAELGPGFAVREKKEDEQPVPGYWVQYARLAPSFVQVSVALFQTNALTSSSVAESFIDGFLGVVRPDFPVGGRQPPPEQFGPDAIRYTFWGISPTGRVMGLDILAWSQDDVTAIVVYTQEGVASVVSLAERQAAKIVAALTARSTIVTPCLGQLQ